MEFQINNYNELLDFIKRDNINAKQATEIVCEALNVISLFDDFTKVEVIETTEYFINKFCINYTGERPIFLGQKENEFSIKDVYKIKAI
jgi:Golgi nucleoside diphosphatase